MITRKFYDKSLDLMYVEGFDDCKLLVLQGGEYQYIGQDDSSELVNIHISLSVDDIKAMADLLGYGCVKKEVNK